MSKEKKYKVNGELLTGEEWKDLVQSHISNALEYADTPFYSDDERHNIVYNLRIQKT